MSGILGDPVTESFQSDSGASQPHSLTAYCRRRRRPLLRAEVPPVPPSSVLMSWVLLARAAVLTVAGRGADDHRDDGGFAGRRDHELDGLEGEQGGC